jgi:hypothetical protein
MRARTLSVVAVVLAVTASLGGAGADAPQPRHVVGHVVDRDLTATAHPGPADPDVTDVAVHVGTAWQWRVVKADTSATASATCDGCHGSAAALQVLYLRHAPATHVDNAAVAWSQCTSCGAQTLSVQLVVLRRGTPLTANNRALATNAACVDCTSTAAAYQLVVVDDQLSRLSPQARADLRAWVDERSASDGHLRTARARLPRTTRALETLVNGDLGSTTLYADAAVDGRP